MRKPITELEIVFEKVEISAEENQQRLDEMFDILFEETLKYMQEKKKNGQLKVQSLIQKNGNPQIERVLST